MILYLMVKRLLANVIKSRKNTTVFDLITNQNFQTKVDEILLYSKLNCCNVSQIYNVISYIFFTI